MANLLNEKDTRCNGTLAIKSKEHSRLVSLLRNALSYYKYFSEEGDEEYELFSSYVKESDDRDIDFILNEQWDSIDNNYDEEETVSSDEEECQYVGDD
jgi:hypothetical protein